MGWIVAAALAIPLAAGAAGAGGATSVELTAEQVVEKNVAARGGAEAWRKIDTMVWFGHLESDRAPIPNLPFVLQQMRPNKTRFEIDNMGHRTVRVFDGRSGWTVHPERRGAPDVKGYTPQETTFALRSPGLDGPLIDYQAKGGTVALEGLEQIEGHKAFRLKVQLASGETDHVWVDAATFLEVRYDRPSYGPTGTPATVTVFYGDYKTVDGLQIPSVVETSGAAGQRRDRMLIDRFMPNAPLDERAFARPGGASRRGGAAMEAPRASGLQ